MARYKYQNQPTVVDGHRFPSKREANRYGELKLLLRAGEIRDLVLQPEYPLVVHGELVCTYVGDFLYTHVPGGVQVLEDAKGVRTKEYIIKKKLLHALHGITIHEV